MSRKQGRENAFKLIYERCITGEDNPLTLSEMCEGLNESEITLLNNLYEGTKKENDFLMSLIGGYSSAFKADRIYKVDLALLLSATYEILFSEDTPFQVVANEAVELCKTYSTEKSYKFVNGLLSSVIRDKEEILNKRSE